MTANVEGMINAAKQAIKSGNKTEARTLLERALEIEEYNEDAWMWLSAAVDTPEEQRTCLENVLVINPENEQAQKGLAKLGGASAPAPPFPPPPSAPAFVEEPPAETSVQWAAPDAPAAPEPYEEPPTASSSASSTFKGQEVSADVYDDWVSGLGISASPPPETPQPQAPPPPVEEKNPLAGTGFNEADFENELESMFGSDDDDDYSYDEPDAPPQFELDDDVEMTSGPFGSPGLFDDLDDEDTDEPAAPAPPPMDAPMMSPGAENVGFDDDEPAKKPSQRPQRSPAAEVDLEPIGTLDPAEYFVFIPEEVKATRLPGEDENYPMPVMMGLIVMVVLNVGAVIFLVMQLVG